MSIFDSIRFVKNNETIYKILINGQWLEASDTFAIKSPIDDSVIAKVQKSSQKEAELAVQTAFNAKSKIANMDACDRAKVLDKMGDLLEQNKNEFIDIIMRESGKTTKQAQGEVNSSIDRLHLAADEAKEIRGEIIKGDVAADKKTMGMATRQPVGVLLAITPFNYPLFTGIAKIAPGIAAGNSIVVKSASDDPVCMLMFGKIVQDSGLPDGVVNVITGSSSEIGDFLCSHPKVDMISFTGSSAAGKHIAGIAGMKKLHLELGGKAPAIILEDCDFNLAVKESVTGSLKFAGQRCDSISRVLVVEQIADKFVKAVIEEVKNNWKFGDPRNADTVVGPLINERAAKKVEDLVNDAVSKGAKLLFGGKRYALGYFEPTVLDNVNRDMRIAWEETFGPVVTIIRVKDYEEALRLANESEYGLDACIFTKDIDKAFDAAQRIEAGSVHINSHPMHGLGIFPFGGDESSGMGREGIKYSIEDMTRVHSIVLHSH